MLTPTLKSTSSPQAQPSEPDTTAGKKFKAEVATNEQASRPLLSDGGKQARAIFGEAATQLKENSGLKAELTQTGSQHISATSLMSRSAEKLEISLPAERVDGGWKAKVASREIGQSPQNLAAVRSDETGKWTIMPDKMEAAGQDFSRPKSYTKSVDNPVKGPYTASQGAEIATKMLNNIAHLEGEDLISAPPSLHPGGGVRAAENIMNAVIMTKGIPGQVYVYEVDGEPAAVMKGKMRDDLERSFHVNFVVSDPYVRGAGTAMLEKAVNLSLANGGAGTVTLEANSAGAADQYRKLGFEDYAPFRPSVWETDLKLDPSRSDQWKKVGDHYSYVGNRDQKNVTGLGQG
jgi:hypothetical protein